MSKWRKKEIKHVEERWVESKTLCDFCNRDLGKVNGKDSSYDYTEIELDAKIGSSYPEGDCREGYRLDCCSECFEQKVKPAIEALGVKWQTYSPDSTYVNGYNFDHYWQDEVPEQPK